MKSVRIVGSGLIGTSIALACKQAGIDVEMSDNQSRAAELAQALVGSTPTSPIELVIIATPPSALHSLIDSEYQRNPEAGFIDVASIKSKSLLEVKDSTLPLTQFCPTHPMAGREVGGAESARADLFHGRSWIVDTSSCSPHLREMVYELIGVCGALPVEMSVDEHDRAVALISHLPQLAASLVAAQLKGAPDATLAISGAGLRDTTRVADSDPRLWSEIVTLNAREIKPILEKMGHELSTLIAQIDDPTFVQNFITKGREGRQRIPGKHGGQQRQYTYLPIVIEDKPGQLHRIFNECAEVDVNVEDLAIEHSPGQQTGLITLALSQKDAEKLSQHMLAKGWNVHPWR